MSLDGRRRDLGNCTYCPKLCRFCCPTAEAEHRETVTPWAKMSLAEMVRTGRLEPDHEVGEIFYHCFGCLHCRTHCEHENDVPGALIEARQEVFRRGAEPPAVSAVIGRFKDSGNAWGDDLRTMLHRQLPPGLFVPEAHAVLFAGCDAIRQETLLGQIFELLGVLGVDYLAAFDGDDLCCGIPLWQAGDLEGFTQHARRVQAALSPYRKVVCPCPTCVYVLKGLYAEQGLAPAAEVVHLTQFLAPLLEGRSPKRQVAGTHVFHDPCTLGRFLDEVELPRTLLAPALAEPLAETVWSGKDAMCCGGGGLVPHVLPEVARKTAGLRVEQLRATGADRIVTACPGCLRQLGGVPEGPQVADLASVLLEAYGSNGPVSSP